MCLRRTVVRSLAAKFRRILCALALLLAPMLLSQAHAAEQRIALVIGNSNYVVGGALANPVNDARLMRDTLANLGFEVLYRENAGQAEMERATSMFATRLAQAKSSSVALFYYAGHGMQSGGENFLLPVDINLQREADLRFNAVRAGDVLAQMDSAGSSVKIVILDACRNNPFANSFGVGFPKGLADIALGNAQFFVAYAATAGKVAADGRGANSPFALALARRLATPNSELSNTFRLVSKDVSEATRNEQLPEARRTMTREFALVGHVPLREDKPAIVADVASAVHLRPTANMLFGKWCEANRGVNGTVFSIDQSQITYHVGREGHSFSVKGIAPASEGRLQLKWQNNGTPAYLEFGEFDPRGSSITQIRGREGSTGPWKDHFRRFRRCG